MGMLAAWSHFRLQCSLLWSCGSRLGQIKSNSYECFNFHATVNELSTLERHKLYVFSKVIQYSSNSAHSVCSGIHNSILMNPVK